MDRSRVKELHYITPIANLASIGTHGILSHNSAERLQHVSIALQSAQDIRAGLTVPNGLALHDYVNLYFDARNAMMYKRLDQKTSIAVLRVHPAVLDIPGTVITDGNAASPSTKCGPSPGGIAGLEEARVYAHSWTHSDPWTYREWKRKRCAEVLVPNGVAVVHLIGCYVYSDAVIAQCQQLCPEIEGKVYRHVFFE
ncbi:hypothetical protein A5760_19620 [Mycobacterium colombiense]|uniref:DarT domain-containing protein n=1 Tax=Mycobacterium colombiense TaxID=339268 RepID=A0A1A0VAN3_9MYCO|nr:DUF4433 domain-containing protein [Mycobacterium colombiense]OBB80298.1 hypothetical protein A5760_19620 [Mycobacterium colombiense]